MTSVGFPQRADFLVCISDRDAYNNAHSTEAENYMKFQIHLVTGAFFLAFGLNSQAEIKTVTDWNQSENATASFKFKSPAIPVWLAIHNRELG